MIRIPLCACLLLLLAACNNPIESITNKDWALYGQDLSNQRYSSLDQINEQTVANLKLAWKINTGRKGTQ